MVIVAAFNGAQRVPDRQRVALRAQKSRTPEGYQANDVARTRNPLVSRDLMFFSLICCISCMSRSSPACKWSWRTTHWSAGQSKPDEIAPPTAGLSLIQQMHHIRISLQRKKIIAGRK